VVRNRKCSVLDQYIVFVGFALDFVTNVEVKVCSLLAVEAQFVALLEFFLEVVGLRVATTEFSVIFNNSFASLNEASDTVGKDTWSFLSRINSAFVDVDESVLFVRKFEMLDVVLLFFKGIVTL